MKMTKLPYEKIGKMTEEERQNYAKSWLYIHNARNEQEPPSGAAAPASGR